MTRTFDTPLGTLTPKHGGWILLAVIAIIYPFTVGDFLLFLAASILALGLYGASFDLIYGYTGLLSFGHAVFYGIGAYAATFAIQDYGQGLLSGLIVGFLLTAIIAIGIGLIAIRVSSHGFVIVTILIVLIANLASVSMTSITGGTDGISVLLPEFTLPLLGEYSMFDPMFRYFFVLTVVAVSLLVMNRLVNSPIGLVFRMIRDNEQRVRMLGYNVTAYKLIAFSVSGAFAGLAGALSMYVTGFVSASHFDLIVSGDAVVYTLVGGRATLIGAIFGAILIEGASNYVSGLTDAYPLIIGALLLATVIFEPEGLVGVYERIRDRLTEFGILPGSDEEEPPAEPDSDSNAPKEVTTDE
ncbi:branched-chain amino acid ABC transporter permease [Natronomonas salina]|uniref:branched-chain amino acid ABC transporter permease n=1 Tax=Natronomonas salina TaxID=1710540 RepID=UPI0015B5365A|nr:branched-chain amino acid ABC transporter permease [Natronomonas salina]QLD89130.1 branched-chain amino acid ABC transporter permease [Natronomonas salina]